MKGMSGKLVTLLWHSSKVTMDFSYDDHRSHNRTVFKHSREANCDKKWLDGKGFWCQIGIHYRIITKLAGLMGTMVPHHLSQYFQKQPLDGR